VGECFSDEYPPYVDVLRKMVSLYDPDVDETDHLSSLLTRQLHPNESLSEYLRDLDLLMTKAFPDASEQKHEQMLKARFVKSIGDKGKKVDHRLYANAKAILKYLTESESDLESKDTEQKENPPDPKLGEVPLSLAEDVARLERQIKELSKVIPATSPEISMSEYLVGQKKIMEDMFREICNQSQAQMAPNVEYPTIDCHGKREGGTLIITMKVTMPTKATILTRLRGPMMSPRSMVVILATKGG
jgi:hypothetical protein